LRFTGVTIPRNAVITSAKVELYSSQSQWITVAMTLAADNVGNSAAWSTSSKPSQRTLTSATVAHSSSVQWLTNTWYQLDEMKTVVQAVVNRADWTSGNSMSVIFKGTGGAWGRKFAKSYEGGAATAPRLRVTYQ
jgi:type IV pilus assembly protein PilY1